MDLFGGYANKKENIRWTAETQTVIFSATKAVGALAIALLVDRGLIKYSDKISSIWPEFAQNNKENITLEMIMSHRVCYTCFFSCINLIGNLLFILNKTK